MLLINLLHIFLGCQLDLCVSVGQGSIVTALHGPLLGLDVLVGRQVRSVLQVSLFHKAKISNDGMLVQYVACKLRKVAAL